MYSRHGRLMLVAPPVPPGRFRRARCLIRSVEVGARRMMISSRQVVSALGVMATLAGCGQPSDSAGRDAPDRRGTPRDLETVREVKKRHSDEILRRYNALGHGITTARKLASPPAPEDEVYVISVFLRSPLDRPWRPQQIGGVPLKFRVTGTIRPL